jgi:predicted O-methyltransferase YrrM
MSYTLFSEEILRYCDTHTSYQDPILTELYRDTYLNVAHPQMISGKVQGAFLSMISRMIAPEAILEIGTFTGYSAYCLCKGLSANGMLTTIDVNEELEEMNRRFFEKAGIAESVHYIIGDALEVIPGLDGAFDLVFIDANKEHYPEYLELIKPLLKDGGYLLADNTLWGGKVTDPSGDASAIALDRFNELLSKDPGFETVLLTIRDGVTLARKIKQRL